MCYAPFMAYIVECCMLSTTLKLHLVIKPLHVPNVLHMHPPISIQVNLRGEAVLLTRAYWTQNVYFAIPDTLQDHTESFVQHADSAKLACLMYVSMADMHSVIMQ